MTGFTVRIELNEANQNDYVALNAAMEKRDFVRFYLGVGGYNYRLPGGEYIYEGEADVDLVLEWAKAAMAETGKTAAIFITESLGWLASGLVREKEGQ